MASVQSVSLGKIIGSFGIGHYQYVDTQFYVAILSNARNAVYVMNCCLESICLKS